jgi:predicted transcriptional regulator
MLAWKQADLARVSGVAEVTIKKIEAGTTDDPRSKTLDAIQRAFERAGILFLEPGDVRDGGPGVRLAKPSARKRGR